jgi:biopolymer transport protein ExbD
MRTRRIILIVLAAAIASAAFGSPAESRDVRLEVTDSGGCILDGRPVLLADLRTRLRELKSTGGRINLHITSRGSVEYKHLMPVVQIAQEEGLAKVGLITIPAAATGASARPPSRADH